MIDGWTIKSFGECAELVRDTVDPEQINPDVPYIGLEHIGEQSLSLLGIGRAEDVTSTKFRFKKGDILFGKLRPYFRKVVRAPFDGICSTDIWVVRPKQGIDPGFLFYWMASKEFIDTSMLGSEGTKMPRAKWEFVSRIQRPIPPLPEQKAIARILGTLDDKIEVNRRMNATLEAMARALFKAWFVDFEPVQAKMSGRWRRGQSLPGLPAHLYDLFPERLVPSELGEIPEGWRVSSVGNEFHITMGQSPPGHTYNQDKKGLPFFQGRKDFGARFPKNRIYCTDPRRIALPGDTLVSVRAPVGDTNMALEKCIIGRGLAAIRHKTGSRSYTYYAMQNLNRLFYSFEGEGTVFGSITKRQFEALPWISPPEKVVEEFEITTYPWDERIGKNLNELAILTQLRDTLLPKLISGQISIHSAIELLEDN